MQSKNLIITLIKKGNKRLPQPSLKEQRECIGLAGFPPRSIDFSVNTALKGH
jgi:hypothetical protein